MFRHCCVILRELVVLGISNNEIRKEKRKYVNAGVDIIK